MRVDVDDVCVDLGGHRILERVCLAVEPGTVLGLVGPNGAGKTTLLRTINAAISPTQGTVRVGEVDIHDLGSRAASRRVATVPQETHLSFAFSVREVVEMGRHPHRDRFGRSDDATLVDEALERTSVADFADRPITDVSGGERQRVLLARALAQDAPVLLLDEPTASLDVNHQVRTLDLVRNLVDEERTVVAAIHDLDLAARYCDELALLCDGTIHAVGSPETVLTEDAVESTFDVPVTITRNPTTGSVSVTAVPAGHASDDGALDGSTVGARGSQSADSDHQRQTNSASDADPSP